MRLNDLVRELNSLNDDNLSKRVISNSDVQWCLSELQDILENDCAKHGRWLKKVNPQWRAHSHDACSICGWWNTRNALCYDGNRKPGHSLNYCPNCGAKMDKEEEKC